MTVKIRILPFLDGGYVENFGRIYEKENEGAFFISGQSYTLVWMPKLKFKSLSDNIPVLLLLICSIFYQWSKLYFSLDAQTKIQIFI